MLLTTPGCDQDATEEAIAKAKYRGHLCYASNIEAQVRFSAALTNTG
ncbi:hypothetical protein NTGBS_170014 [Candidatus Nitrotoga sp. BS]|nr:hypothetical protein [Candidatus Nitrotoga sp. BS]CAH1194063.1 hypothetical protein NTGBS_170014 [Candidatus Nitrotoga sp. BS]